MKKTRELGDFDAFAAETVECPHAFFEALRRDAPLYPLPGGQYTLVSRYDDIRRMALDPSSFSSNLVGVLFAGADAPSPELLELPSGGPRPVDVLALADAPVHTRQRKLVNRAFSPKRVAALEAAVRTLADELFAGFQDRGRVEWMAEFAVPLPMTMICDLIGFPRADAVCLQSWTDDGVALLSGISTQEQIAGYARSIGELNQYLAGRFAEARQDPGDDVLGDLVRATREDEECLSDDEVVSILLQLLTAGQETTASLIGSAALLLVQRPELQARLRQDPARIPDFVEEALRLESPFHGHFRLARDGGEVAGVPVAAGTRLMLLWSSANRDPEVFENPEQLDIDRDNLRAHLGFGIGIHRCLGAQLARLEARVALETLLGRTRELHLAGEADALSHQPSLFVRRLENLPLTFR